MRLALILLVVLGAAPAHAQVLGVGDKLVELDIGTDRNGKPAKLAAYRGRWVVVTMGAAWCPPCVKELPVWDRLAGEFKGRIAFISIAIDDQIADGIAFHDRLKLVHLARMYLPADRSAVVARYGADTMPTTFVADPDGRIKYVHTGFQKRDPEGEYKKLKAQLDTLVPPPKPKPQPTPKPPAKPPAKPPSDLKARATPLPPLVVAIRAPGTLWSARWQELVRF